MQNNSQQSKPNHPAIRQFGEDEFTNLDGSTTKQHNIMFLVGNGFDIAVEGVRKFVCEALIEREFHR